MFARLAIDLKVVEVFQSETQKPKRTFSAFDVIVVAFNICQAWAAVGATFALLVAHGGSVKVVYGFILIFLVYSAIALSTAEMAARYPTSGGQYYWTAMVAPKKAK